LCFKIANIPIGSQRGAPIADILRLRGRKAEYDVEWRRFQDGELNAKLAPTKGHWGAKAMARIHYRIVAHDGGWAYKLNDVFSEPFSSRSAALAAARRVAAEQRVPGDTTQIEYEDESGKWHTELSEGDDRPDVDVVA
jgi:hypothetical protein